MQLDKREEDGSTLRAHLVASGARDQRLSSTPPAACRALWQAYCALNSCRPASMGGLVCVPPSEIIAWQQLHGVQLNPWEVETLMAMDRAAVAAYHSKGALQ